MKYEVMKKSIHNLLICVKISILPVGDNYGISGGNVIGMIAYLLFYGKSESFTVLDTWYEILEAYPSLQGIIYIQIYRLTPSRPANCYSSSPHRRVYPFLV